MLILYNVVHNNKLEQRIAVFPTTHTLKTVNDQSLPGNSHLKK